MGWSNPYEVPTGSTSDVINSGIVALVGHAEYPPHRFEVGDFIYYIGDNIECWPPTRYRIPTHVRLEIGQKIRLLNANGDFAENAYLILAKRGRLGNFVSPDTATPGFHHWQGFPDVPERLLSDSPLLTPDS